MRERERREREGMCVLYLFELTPYSKPQMQSNDVALTCILLIGTCTYFSKTSIYTELGPVMLIFWPLWLRLYK